MCPMQENSFQPGHAGSDSIYCHFLCRLTSRLLSLLVVAWLPWHDQWGETNRCDLLLELQPRKIRTHLVSQTKPRRIGGCIFQRTPLKNIHSNPLPPSPVRCQRLSIKKQFPHRDQACAMRKRKRMRENVRYGDGERTRIIHVSRGCRISAESGLQKQSLSRRIRALPNQIRRIRFL